MKFLYNLETMLYKALEEEDFVILFIALLLSPLIALILWIYCLVDYLRVSGFNK